MTMEPLVDELRNSATEVRDSVAGQSSDAMHYKPAPDQWSAHEIICHLVDVERLVFRQRLARLLAEDNPHFPDIDHKKWPEEHQYARQDPERMLQQFLTERGETTELAESVAEEKWALQGNHEKRGPMSFADVVKHALDHTRRHVRQIQQTLEAYTSRET
jgi:hypothetical protein